MDLTTFKAQINEQGIARNTRWKVEIFPPANSSEGDPSLTNASELNNISLYCSFASIPARDLKNIEWNDTNGESRQLGVVHTHKGITLSFYCSEDMRERKYFETWQDWVFNPSNKQRRYYSSYIGKLNIIKYSNDWEEVARYEVLEAYPTNIAMQELVQSGTTAMAVEVSFKYKNYTQTK